MVLSTVGIGSMVFANWIATAEENTQRLIGNINENIYNQVSNFIHAPVHINEVNHNIIQNEILDLSNEPQREKFFIGVLQNHEDDIYSFSYGTETGEYYGARRNAEGDIEIMKNNAETEGNSWYFEVNDDLTAGPLTVRAGEFDPRTRAWYQEAKGKKASTFSPIYKHFVMDDLTISAAWPIYDGNGQLEGVMGAHMLLSSVGGFLDDAVNGYEGYALIVEKESGLLIANSMELDNFAVSEDGTFQRFAVEDLENASLRQAFQQYVESQETDFDYEDEEERYFVDVREIRFEGLEWVVLSALPEGIYMTDAKKSIGWTAAIIFLVLLLSVLVFHVITKRLLKPMDELLQTSADIAAGDLSKRVEVKRRDEIGVISLSMNNMADKMHDLINNLEANVEARTAQLNEATVDLEENKNQLQLILDSTAEAIYGIDLDGNCTFSNASCIQLLGYDNQNDLLGKNMHTLIHHSYEDGTPFPLGKCGIVTTIREGKAYESDEEVFWRADETSIRVEYRSYPQIRAGEVVGGVITFMDITQRKLAEERIKFLSYHDPVTGLYNRTFLYEELKRLNVDRNLPFSVIMGDVNGLKLTNDIFGHEAGDVLLKRVAEAMQRSCREEDIIARVGGDEFVILLPKTDNETAGAILKRIKGEVEKEESKELGSSISLGKGTKYDTLDDMAEVLKHAEGEMYRNKSLRQMENHDEQLQLIMKQLHERSEREKIHSANVSELSEKLGRELGLTNEAIRKLKDAGYYHDIGKIVFDEEILARSGVLSKEEQREMNKHGVVGYRILSLFNSTMDIARAALHHHEHWDGTGHPAGLKREEISLMGRIVAVAEAYDDRTNPRSNIPLGEEETLKEIQGSSGKKFDPTVVEALIRVKKKENKG
ncbi:diguanylate cyclase [Alkalibacter rhizosphaerae]|uniref:Diguanylate cyclase n=2 Tax=Alkalibacter rhizosphaerae TaxID=2815577 RepID=A0A974XH67_9FIRM|nr:diguanylate cyclase [Alkalibacter rhizosphaerae]